MNEDLPIPQGPEFSDDFRDFVTLCMQKDPLQRAQIDQLLAHPFITRVGGYLCRGDGTKLGWLA
jgi:serine/threonine protein kinase